MVLGRQFLDLVLIAQGRRELDELASELAAFVIQVIPQLFQIANLLFFNHLLELAPQRFGRVHGSGQLAVTLVRFGRTVSVS